MFVHGWLWKTMLAVTQAGHFDFQVIKNKVIFLDYSKHRSHIYFCENKKIKSHPLALLGECSCGITGNWVQVDVESFVIWSSKTYISQASLVLHVAVLCLQTNSTINGGAKANNKPLERPWKNRRPRNKKQRPCSRHRQLEKFMPTAINKGHRRKTMFIVLISLY